MGIRWDSHGLLWQDAPPERATRGEINRPLPTIPDTGWLPPRELPSLSGAPVIAIDCETRDPNIQTLGPGDCRGDGEVVGVSVAVPGMAWYFPLRHTIESHLNMDPEKVFAWLREQLAASSAVKVGHRLAYDLAWLEQEGVRIPGPYYDTSIAAALLDENRHSYSLDSLGEEYTGQGKVDDDLYRWCQQAYGGKPGRPQIANIWRAPPQLAGPYAEADARLPLQIREKQLQQLTEQHLDSVARVEMGLIPMLHAMRRRGVRINDQGAAELEATLQSRIQDARARYKAATGTEFVDSNQQLAQAFDAAGIQYPRTEKGNPSFPKDWLVNHPSPLAAAVAEIRRWEKARGTFVEGYLLTHSNNGRIHAEINQIRFAGDSQGERGTIGRFSYTNPNLQNIPSRDKHMKRAVRGLFLPEEGELWESDDYSQIEFRMLAHFALGPGSDAVRRAYQEDSSTDYHDMAQDMVRTTTGIDLDRKPTKNINFGLVFGMGEEKITSSLGVDNDTAAALFAAYHEALPFAKYTYNKAMDTAQTRGYIRTLLGRRRRYTLWESRSWERSRKDGAMPHAEALALYGPGIRRAYTNSALNNVLQLSAADLIKKAMVDIWESGVCDVVGPPLVQVHDELDWSVPQTPAGEEAMREARHLMVSACPSLTVPVRVEYKRGPNWGDLT